MTKEPQINTDNEVIIIGAGIAGLTAAIKLKEQGVKFKILEVSDKAGGRTETITTKNGNVVDMGGQWLHGGMENPLRPLVEKYNIPYENDVVGDKSVVSYYGGQRHVGTKFRDSRWQEEIKINNLHELKTAFNARQARNKAENGEKDCALVDTVPEASQDKLSRSIPTWGGTRKKDHASYAEFASDNSALGGLQIKGGTKALIDAMVKEIGKENIIYNTPVTEILNNKKYGVSITTENGDIYTGKKAIFTGSVGVLKNNNISFEPSHGKEMQEYLDGLTMARFAKIVIEVDSKFFANKPHLKNMHIDLLDKEPSIFCHVGSNGNSTITVMVGAEAAEEIEKMSPKEALAFAKKRLAPVVELQGYEQYVQGEPLVTSWINNHNNLGSYSARKVGGKRNCGLQEGNVLYAGEAFDDSWSCTMAGAYRSGENAAQQVSKQLAKTQIVSRKSDNQHSAGI